MYYTTRFRPQLNPCITYINSSRMLYRVLCFLYCTLINTQYPARGKSIYMHYIVIM